MDFNSHKKCKASDSPWYPCKSAYQGNIGIQVYASRDRSSDVTLVVGNSDEKTFKAHKCILELRAKVLYDVVCANEKDSLDDTIELCDSCPKVFDAM